MRTLMRHNHFRLFAFWREGRGERLLVVMNSGERSRSGPLPLEGGFPEGAILRDLVSGREFRVADGSVHLDRLAPRTGLILAHRTV